MLERSRGGFALCSPLLISLLSCAKVEGGVSVDGGASGATGTDGLVDQPTLSLPDAGRDVTAFDASPGCVNLKCQQVSCPGAPTSISGTVFAPNGKLPLYNVIVYVPNAPLDPFPAGLTCDRCGVPASGKPVVSTLSNSDGSFKLLNVPAGANIPLVFQVGKWRRKVTVPKVTACQDTALTDPNMTRLPRNRAEGELPKIAVTTGVCDELGCLLPKLGIDGSELGIAGEDKSAAYFAGSFETAPGTAVEAPGRFGPANMRPATELWNDEGALSKYDMTLLGCECAENLTTKSAMSFKAMNNYLTRGGRIFGSHYSYVWLKNSPDMQLTSAMAIEPGDMAYGQWPLKIDTTFPKGKALADWMKFVDPAVVYGEISSAQTFNKVRSVMPPSALAWASSPRGPTPPSPPDAGVSDPQPHPRIVTINTPAGMPADKQCGRAAYLDAHIVQPGATPPPANQVFPATCGTALSKGEEALAFLFFDLAACIQDDTMPVVPPLVIP
jgi:hypothetical protein